MGGSGSGRRPYKYKYTVEDCLSIDMGMMLRGKKIKPGWHAIGTLSVTVDGPKIDIIAYEIYLELKSPYIRLQYNSIDKFVYNVFLTSTKVNYGGIRYWFCCPECGKRVWKLYWALGSKYFLCRTCQKLTYRSCRRSHSDDTIIKYVSLKTGLPWAEAKQALFDLRKKYWLSMNCKWI